MPRLTLRGQVRPTSAKRPATEPRRVVMVAIAGGSGAGKSWLARRLKARLGTVAGVVALDDFYQDLRDLPRRTRATRNFDVPDAIDWPLFEAQLEALAAGEPTQLPRYDFRTHTRRPRGRRWQPRRVVLIEGLWPWWRPELRRHYTLKIYKVGSEELRLARRLARDTRRRGRDPGSVRTQWRRQVQPMHARFVHPQARSADVTLPPETPAWQLDRIVRRIRELAGLEP
jgi:uridine kinase